MSKFLIFEKETKETAWEILRKLDVPSVQVIYPDLIIIEVRDELEEQKVKAYFGEPSSTMSDKEYKEVMRVEI